MDNKKAEQKQKSESPRGEIPGAILEGALKRGRIGGKTADIKKGASTSQRRTRATRREGGAERIVTIEKGDRDQSKHGIPAMAGAPREGVNIIDNIN